MEQFLTDNKLNIQFSDIFELNEIQHMQDLFSNATGVASLITLPNGKPYTKPSNFTRLCNDIIRNTKIGCANCAKSDAYIGGINSCQLIVMQCLSAGLWDAGVPIIVNGQHLANWLIGQVQTDDVDIEKMKLYADEIGVCRDEFLNALDEVPKMPREKFEKVSEMLYLFVKDLSEKAYTNLRLKSEIEEREKAVLELQLSQESLLITLQSIGDGVISTDIHGVIVDMNPVAEQLCGYTQTDAKGKLLAEVFNIINHETRKPVENPVKSVLENGEIVGLANHTVLISSTGAQYRITNTAAPKKNKNGEIIGVVLVFSDITHKYESEALLRQSEQKQSILFMHSPDAYFTIVDGFIVDCNKAAERMMCGTRNQIVGQTPTSISPPYQLDGKKSAEAAQENIDKAILNGVNTFDWHHLGFDDTDLFVEISLVSIILEGKQTLFATWRDIAKRKQAEEALENERLLLRTLIDNMPDAIYTKDLQCRKTFSNKADVRNTGFKDELDVLGKNDFEVFPADIAQQFFDDDQRVMVSGEPVLNREEYLESKSGESQWLLTSKLPIFNKRNQIVGLLGIGRDISIRRKSEQALRESEKFLKDTQLIAKLGTFTFEMNTGNWLSSEVLDTIFGINKNYTRNAENWMKMVHQDWKISMSNYFANERLDTKAVFNMEYKIVRQNDLSERWVHGIGEFVLNNNTKTVNLIGTIQDITELKQTQIALEQQLKIQQLLVSISAQYINLPLEKIETAIPLSLCQLAHFVGADRAYVFEYDFEKQLSNNTYEWCAQGVSSEINNLKNTPFSKIIHHESHFSGDILTVADVLQLSNGPLKEWMLQRNIKSMITLPMMLNGVCIGFVGFDSITNFHTYTNNEQFLLITFSQMLVNIQLRMHTEEILQNERLLLRTVIDNIPDTIYAKDLNLNKTLANKAEVKLLGASSEEEIVGYTDVKFYDSEFATRFMEDDRKVLESLKPDYNREGFILNGKGEMRWFLSSKLPLRNKDNQIIGLVGIGHDITYRKQTEAALRISEQKYRTIFENVQDVFYQVDMKGIILDISSSVKNFSEFNKDEIVGTRIDSIYTNARDQKKLMQELTQNGEIRDYELTIKTSHGGIKQVSVNARLNYDNSGKPTHVDGAIRDISKRKNAEAALALSELKFKNILENSPFHIWASDGKVYTFVNKTYCTFTGLNEDEMMVENAWLNLIHPDDYESAKSIWIQALETKSEHYNFFRLRNKDGVYRNISSHIVPIFDENNQFKHFQGFNIDITERILADVALNKSQEELKKFAAHLQNVREEERIMLAREIHDELGQILIAIKIDTGLLKQKALKYIDNNHYSELLDKFNALSGLVDNTINTTRKIMTDLRPEVLYMLGFVEAVKLHTKKFEERHNIFCLFTTDIPKLKLNEQQSVALFRIVQEALTNIVKHANATKVDISIKLLNKKLILEITDNGVGISKKNKVRPDSYGMIGMKERMFLLEGELSITGENNIGTTVKAMIPYEVEEEVLTEKGE